VEHCLFVVVPFCSLFPSRPSSSFPIIPPGHFLVISLLFPGHLPIITSCCLHILPSFFLLIIPHHRLLPPTNHKTSAGLFVINHLACLSCSPLVSRTLLLVAELGLGHLVSETIATSSLESKKKRKGIS
jgi:hypothetical protein